MSTELYLLLYTSFSSSTNINYFISLSLPLWLCFANYKRRPLALHYLYRMWGWSDALMCLIENDFWFLELIFKYLTHPGLQNDPSAVFPHSENKQKITMLKNSFIGALFCNLP